MASIVLVHGAWQSARSWDLVRHLIADRGHEVILPVLSGLGEDAANLDGTVNLTRHVDDVCRAMVAKGAREVVLVGHSYAGAVITGVAEKMPDRLAKLVFVDAFIPEDRECVLDLLPDSIVALFRESAARSEEGWRLPASEGQLDWWGLARGSNERNFAEKHLSDFSIRCFEEALDLPYLGRQQIECAYIAGAADGYPLRQVFGRFADKARLLGWRVDELPTGHDPHIEMPRDFVDLVTKGVPPSEHLLG
jgi:pimeloyl-ACP methyl ester carboxylesterase